MRAMTSDGVPGSSLAKRSGSAAAELEPRIDRKKELSDALTGEAVDRVLGDDVSPELKKAIKGQIAPWAERLVRMTDELFRIPGTDIHIGLDPIIGLLLPGAGDVITGTGSIALLLLGLKERLPTIALGRMVANVAIDTVGGAVPILGDVWDVYWRSNRKNLEIIEKYKDDPKAEATTVDKVLVYGGITIAVIGILIPLVLGAIFGIGIGALFGS
jgi:hypothetical protein